MNVSCPPLYTFWVVCYVIATNHIYYATKTLQDVQ